MSLTRICDNCKRWVTAKKTLYEDGTETTTFAHARGQGFCSKLDMITKASFGCNEFAEGMDHVEVTIKEGAPWQNWHMDKCPECNGRGSHMVEIRPACRRCAGLGQVRHYDDGYIADASWDHPKEKELKKQLAQPPPPGLAGTTLAPVEKNDRSLGGS